MKVFPALSVTMKHKVCKFCSDVKTNNLVLQQKLSHIVLLDDWHTLPENLVLLDKGLGGGRFGTVQQGLLRVKEGESRVVAVKTVKGTVNTSLLRSWCSRHFVI